MGGKPRFSHVGAKGEANMVGVSDKSETTRRAVATALVRMSRSTFDLLVQNKMKNGDILSVAKVAGIQGAKKTSQLIPLCHPLRLTKVDVELTWKDKPEVLVTCTATAVDRTGVEMEALMGASIAALTVYDMCKAVEPGMIVDGLSLKEKVGGKRGLWTRDHAKL